MESKYTNSKIYIKIELNLKLNSTQGDLMVSKLLTAKIEDYDSRRKRKYEYDIEKIVHTKKLLEEQRKVLQEWYKALKLNCKIKIKNQRTFI